MDRSGNLYRPEEVVKLDRAQRDELQMITEQEYNRLARLSSDERINEYNQLVNTRQSRRAAARAAGKGRNR